MKTVLASLLLFSTFSVQAKDLISTVSHIEFEKNASCRKSGGSLLNLCSGSVPMPGSMSVAYTCVYTVKYHCVSNSGDFKLKLRVKESYNKHTLMRESNVLKVTISR